jgi:general secretion pathway protein D
LLTPPSQDVSPGQTLPSEKERQKIVLNFDKADIAEVTSQIFGDQLKLNYVIDQTLQGRLSMYIEGEFTSQELLQMVTRAYESNGVSVVPKKNFYYIQSAQKTGGGSLPIATPLLLQGKEGTRPIVVIYRLRYMDPKQAANLITPFLSPGRKVVTEPLTNSVIFIEETDNARTLINLLKTIDINILQEVSMEVIPLQSIAPEDAVKGMESMMTKLGGIKDSSLKNSLALIPLQSFGGVLVLAQTPELLKSAKQWLQAIDIKGLGSTEEIYVYFVQNGLAADITDILNQVFGISGGTSRRMQQQLVPSGSTATRSAFGGSSFGGSSFGSSSGLGSSSSTGGLSGSSFGSSTGTGLSGSTSSTTGAYQGGTGSTSGRTGGTSTGTAGRAGTGATGRENKPSIFSGEVMIIADEVNNAIVIRANAVDYAKIKKTLDTLDILPRAVLVEVMIVEVQLNKEFQYGLQYWYQTHPQNQTGLGASFGGLSNTAVSSTTSTSSTVTQTTSGGFPNLGSLSGAGMALSWVANAQNFAAFLNMLSSKTNITVLSTPTLLATDNKEATIVVGGEEPVPTGSYAGTETGTGVFSTIQYEETGVILTVTPHINAGGLVRLELQTTVRRPEATPATVGQDNTAPVFTERDIKTTLLAQTGSTVVIGGIIDSSQQTAKNGIPFLQDLPLLSPLFSTTSNTVARTELLVAITPHVIDQRGSEAPRELLEKLNNLKKRVTQ